MRRALVFAMLGALGCQPKMTDMMEGGPMDGGPREARVDMPDGMPPPDADPSALRVNHMQLRATTNSYHTFDNEFDLDLLGYTHLPLVEQAGAQGIRFFDFDLVPDREGGIGLDPQVTDDTIDGEAICLSWYWCLREFVPWMDAHPDHALIVFLVGEAWLFATTPGLHFQLDDLESMVVRAIGRDRVLTPADVRGEHATLREAISDGWPTVEATRGKVMFVLNDRALARERYIERGGLNPDDRLLFLIGDPDAADAGDEVVFSFEPEYDGDPWYYDTDPAELGRIEALARAGYLVHGISDDPAMIADLRAAGAHFIGTRFPERLGGIPPAGPIGCNPVAGPDDCDPAELEPQR